MPHDARFEMRIDPDLRGWLMAEPGRGSAFVRDLLQAAREGRVRVIPRENAGPPELNPFPGQPTIRDQDVLLVCYPEPQ